MAASGVVFDIQRFSLHDGPGIRTTVFLKGCPLACLWCANPESQRASPGLLVRDARCRRCGACAKACPEGAITVVEGEARTIDLSLCSQCLKCVEACAYLSLVACGREMTADEVMVEVLRDRVFYDTSDGGVTISGGEALQQAEFLQELATRLEASGLHTALDTSGFAPWDVLAQVLPRVDLVLWDIKHLDPRAHIGATGVGNERILENLRRASDLVRIWLRVPLIAGFNDSDSHIGAVVALAREVGADRISLLPYHEGGESKSRQIGVPYAFEGGRAPDDDRVRALAEMIETNGIRAAIGS